MFGLYSILACKVQLKMEANYLHVACEMEYDDEAALKHWFLINNPKVWGELKRESD